MAARRASEQVELLWAFRDAIVELQRGAEQTNQRLSEAIGSVAQATAQLERASTRRGALGARSTPPAEPPSSDSLTALLPTVEIETLERVRDLETQLRELREELIADRIHFKLRVDRLERHSGLVPTD